MKKSLLYTLLASMIPSAAMADINFETSDGYTGLGVYDCWTESPFRTGRLTGNVMVTDNPDKSVDAALGQAPNASAKVLGAQRSRFGSNLFGVRIDLDEKIDLTTTTKYVHVMMYRPVSGRVALVGLGKRNDRDDQTGEEEQFWVLSSSEVQADRWSDAVFAIKGANNIKIHSLVVVPECESPHNSAEDFLFYIDDITVNDDIKPRMSTEFYTINFNKTAEKITHSSRNSSGVTMTSPSCGSQSASVDQASDKLLYHFVDNTYFRAKAGETVTFGVNFNGEWMHAYIYLDRDNDGQFEASVGSNSYTPQQDLLTYSFYGATTEDRGYNSTGQSISGNARNTVSMPSVTLPADLKAGAYRLRYKVDWNDINPGGSNASGNTISGNGGAITDIILMVGDGSPVTVHANQLNGDVATESGEVLSNNQAEFGQPFTIKMLPAPGFEYSGIKVRHGVLSGEAVFHDNPQYHETTFGYELFDENDCFTLPAEIMDGDVMIEGLFVQEGTLPKRVTVNYTLECNGTVIGTKSVSASTGQPYPEVAWDMETSPEFYTIEGMPDDVITVENTDITLQLMPNLPFEVSRDFENAYWYNMTITADKKYLTHNSSRSYIDLSSSTTATPGADDHNSQWCFVGDVYNGFKIMNRGAGNGMILSSSTNTSSNTGGNTYPTVKSEPVSDGNTLWIPTKSNNVSNSFYLHQKGIPSNRMNSRDDRLAYWTGGADAGSSFTVVFVGQTSGIDDIGADTEDDGPAVYYNLQGIRINVENLTPGIYICRQGNKVTKILVK